MDSGSGVGIGPGNAWLRVAADNSVATVATQVARLALTNQLLGDICVQVDTGVTYLLTALPSSSNGNWTAIAVAPALATAQATVTFDAGGTEDTTAEVVIVAPWVKATSKIFCSVSGGTVDHPATDEDAAIEDILASAFNIVPGTGFSVCAFAPQGSRGDYLVNCLASV